MIIRAATLAGLLALSARAEASDRLSDFFTWWNHARGSGQAFRSEGFAPFVAPNAVLVLDGKAVATTRDGWSAYFEGARAKGGEVEIVIPFKHSFKTKHDIYTLHIVRARRPGGLATCSLTSGYATIERGLIVRMELVRHSIDLSLPDRDALCWSNKDMPDRL